MSQIGYLELIRTNAAFRRLWSASVISMLGEWFNTIALFLIIYDSTESEFLLGLLFTMRMVCFALFQPFGGLLADRINRKNIMIWTNILQVFLALSFLVAQDAEHIGWIYLLTGLMMVLHGMYVTAERASLPNIVPKEHLATANALDAASWSTALCVGAMLGGIVVEYYGTDTAFIIDAVTFAVSAILLRRLVIPQTIDEDMKGPLFSTTISNIKKGWSRIVSEKRLLRIVFAKSSWNIAGGGLAGVFLVVAGSDLDGFGMALGFGIFFFARGIGNWDWTHSCTKIFGQSRPLASPCWFTGFSFWFLLLPRRLDPRSKSLSHRRLGDSSACSVRCKLGPFHHPHSTLGGG